MVTHRKETKNTMKHLLAGHRRERQRMMRGFSDSDAWNGDGWLADRIANLFTYYADGNLSPKGSQYPAGTSVMSNDAEDHRKAQEALNADLTRVGGIFRRYSQNDVWDAEADAKQFGGCTHAELDDALLWLATNFETLWD
jgi:hypothetical protein